jgi:hypothetical protein
MKSFCPLVFIFLTKLTFNRLLTEAASTQRLESTEQQHSPRINMARGLHLINTETVSYDNWRLRKRKKIQLCGADDAALVDAVAPLAGMWP